MSFTDGARVLAQTCAACFALLTIQMLFVDGFPYTLKVIVYAVVLAIGVYFFNLRVRKDDFLSFPDVPALTALMLTGIVVLTGWAIYHGYRDGTMHRYSWVPISLALVAATNIATIAIDRSHE